MNTRKLRKHITGQSDMEQIIWMAVAILVFFTIAYLYGYARCNSRAKLMGVRCSYGPFQDCMIEITPKKWIPLEQHRVLGNDNAPS